MAHSAGMRIRLGKLIAGRKKKKVGKSKNSAYKKKMGY